MTERVGYITLTGIVEKDEDSFIATCLELGTATCGDSIEEAFENLEEAIWVHLNALEEVGERDRVFRENNIEIVSSVDDAEACAKVIPLDKVVKASRHEVPIHA